MVDVLRSAPATNPGAGEIFQILRDGTARTKAELAAQRALNEALAMTRKNASLDPVDAAEARAMGIRY